MLGRSGKLGLSSNVLTRRKELNLDAPLLEGGLTRATVEVTQLTESVSPKIMFLKGSRLRPWIIHVGLDFHVISPPSNETTVLDIGAQFAVGAQYRLYKAFHLGVDG